MMRRAPLLVLPIVLAIYSHLWYLHHLPVRLDDASEYNLAQTAAFRAIAASPGNPVEKFVGLWSWPCNYPPLVYGVTSALGAASIPSAVASLSLYLAILAAGAFMIGESASGPLLGGAAALLAVMDPSILNLQECYYLDMPVTAMVVLCLALLIRTRRFSVPAWSRALGVALGLGFLTKFTLVWFLTVPVAIDTYFGLRAAARREWVLFLVLFSLFGGIFWALCQLSLSWQAYIPDSGTIAPTGSTLLVVSNCLLCGLGLLLTSRLLAPGPPRNALDCTFLAAFVAGPWIIVNQCILQQRWQTVEFNSPAMMRWVLTTTVAQIPLFVLVLGVIGVFCVLFDAAQRRTLSNVVVALVVGTFATVLELPLSLRFGPVTTVLVAVLAIVPFARRPPWPTMLFVCALVWSCLNLLAEPVQLWAPNSVTWLKPVRRLVNMFEPGPLSSNACDELAVDALRRFPAGVHSVDILMANPSRQTATIGLRNMLTAHSMWDGRLLEISMFMMEAKEIRPWEIPPTVFTVQVRTLARRSGARMDGFTSRHGQRIIPDAIMIEPRTRVTLSQIETYFQASYTQAEPLKEWELLLRDGLQGPGGKGPNLDP